MESRLISDDSEMVKGSSTDSDSYAGSANLEVMAQAKNYNRFLEGLIRKNAPKPLAAVRIVDFGAGIGTFSYVLGKSGCSFIAVEADPDQSQILRSLGYQVEQLDGIADGSIDFIYTLNVLEHIEDDVGTLRRLRYKLKQGGTLLIYVPAFTCLWTAMDDAVGHVRRYRAPELKQKLTSAGFGVETCCYMDSAGYFATLLYKHLGNNSGAVSTLPLIVFDRLCFPLGRLLDKAGFSRFLGKNVYALARR